MDWKALLTSRTIIGAVVMAFVTLLAPTLQKHGIPVPSADTLTGKVIDALAFGLTVYGRIHATGPLKEPSPPSASS